jgi:hypothetical protein
VKHRLKFILLLLISFCYFSTVFEWDSKERKQNYEKENHCYVSSINPADTYAFHFDTPNDLPTTYIDFAFRCDLATKSVQPLSYTDEKPPDKIFLRHRALLI